jgi:AraC-like DNA-binding protein
VVYVKSKINEIDKINLCGHVNYHDAIAVEKKTLNKNFRLHWHNYYEIEYITDGSGKEILNGKEVEIHEGVLNVISPSDFHEIIVDSPLTMVKICFDISILDSTVFSEALNVLNGRLIRLGGKNKELFDSLFETVFLQNEIYGKSKLFSTVIKNSLCSILLSAAEYLRKNCDSTENEKQNISAALAYVHANFKRHITLKKVAEAVHFSEAYLSRHFHESLGVTFSQYVKNLRMDYAKGLLLNTDTEITNICYEAGFSSPQSFANEFKKIYKMTPSEYRNVKR